MPTSYIPLSGPGRRLSKIRCQACIFSMVLLVLVRKKAIQFWNLNKYTLGESSIYTNSNIDQPVLSSSSDFRFPSLPVLSRNDSFGACLMVKGDNDLLSEWIPYHYTLLPLRHLLVATDVGNSEDPKSVLKKWTAANTDLHWWVVNVSQFENMHGEFNKERTENLFHRKVQSNGTIDPKMIEQASHSRLVHKQKAMITYCTNFMKERGVRWVSMYDTDEFLVINRMGTGNKGEDNSNQTRMLTRNKIGEAEPLDETHGMRPHLPPMESNATVVDIIHSFERAQHPLKSCHTIPRVSFGSIENFTCPGSEDVTAFAKANFDYHSLSTLRFQQHAVKESFKKNRFSKVFIDVSNISDQTLSLPPKNIHRPFREECLKPVAVFQQAPFYLMHYAGGWERFQSKDDKRRGFEKWKELADVSDSTSCCEEEVYRWLPRFVDQVGLGRAKFLLGENNSRHKKKNISNQF